MDFLTLILKSASSFITLFILARILGKKQIEQLNIFDYVVGITIGNIVAEMSINKDISFIDGTIAMIVYTVISLFINYITMKSMFLRRIFSTTPIVVIENGEIIEENLKKIKFDINDLLEEARINGYFNIKEVKYAIMEANVKLSFIPKESVRCVKIKDLNINVQKEGLCANLIIDGHIMKEHLKFIKKDEKWLINALKKNGYDSYENLLLVTIDANLKLSIYEKGKKQKEIDCLE